MKKNLYYGLMGCLMSFAPLNALAQSDSTIVLERGDSLVLNAPDGFSTYRWQVSNDGKYFHSIPDANEQKLVMKVYAHNFYRLTAIGNDTTIRQTTEVNMKEIHYFPEPSVSGGSHGYVETRDGKLGNGGITIKEDRVGSVAGSSIPLTNWKDENSMAVYYLHHPQSIVDTKMEIAIKRNRMVALRVKVFDPSDMSQPMAENIVALRGTGKPQTVDLIGLRFPKSIYYRYQIECLTGCTGIDSISHFYHYSPSSTKSYKSGYLSSPSVHLNQWRSSAAGAPTGSAYDWCYMEVMMPEESDIPGTYVMSLGVLDGYMGIQMNGYENGKPLHDVIFSMWDHGDVDENPDLPDNLRANVVDHGPGVKPDRFNNEGTGMKTFKKGYNWDCGTFVQFITNCRPEDATYTVVENGKEVVKHQKNTLCSTWYNAQDGKGWQYMATLRLANKQINFDSWYSFLENYNWPTGQVLRRGYYRNGYGHAKSSGKWYHFNQINFGHTDGGTAVGARQDFGQGDCDEFENTFFMTTGGFIPSKVTAPKVRLNKTNTPVDTINLNALLERVDQAVATEKAKIEAKENFRKNKIAKTGWKLLDFSSEETEGERENGRAAFIIDDDPSTYWHSQYSGKKAGYPHFFIVDMAKEHELNAFQIIMSGGVSRCIKSYKLYTSLDNKEWVETYSDDNAPKQESFQVMLPASVKARYFKLEILEGYASEGPFVRVNEIDFTEGKATGIEAAQTSQFQVSAGNGEVLVKVPAALTNAEISVFRADGACVATENFATLSAGEVVHLPMATAAKGVYVVACKADQFNAAKQIMWNK